MGKPVGIKNGSSLVISYDLIGSPRFTTLNQWLIFELAGNLVQYWVNIYFQAVSHYEETFQKSCSIMVVITESAKR